MLNKSNLFSNTRMKLLAFIASRKGEYYERQIAREAGVSAGSANAILKSFERMGFVKKAVRGRMNFYERNERSPLLRQFRVLISISRLMPVIDAVAPLSKRVVLLGAHAEGRSDDAEMELFILSHERELVRRALEGFRGVRPLILDVVGLEGLKQRDRARYDRIMRGIELHREEG